MTDERKYATGVDEDAQDALGLPDAPDGATGRPGPGFGTPSFDPLAPPHPEPPFDTRRGGAGGVPTAPDWKIASDEGPADSGPVEPVA